MNYCDSIASARSCLLKYADKFADKLNNGEDSYEDRVKLNVMFNMMQTLACYDFNPSVEVKQIGVMIPKNDICKLDSKSLNLPKCTQEHISPDIYNCLTEEELNLIAQQISEECENCNCNC